MKCTNVHCDLKLHLEKEQEIKSSTNHVVYLRGTPPEKDNAHKKEKGMLVGN